MQTKISAHFYEINPFSYRNPIKVCYGIVAGKMTDGSKKTKGLTLSGLIQKC